MEPSHAILGLPIQTLDAWFADAILELSPDSGECVKGKPFFIHLFYQNGVLCLDAFVVWLSVNFFSHAKPSCHWLRWGQQLPLHCALEGQQCFQCFVALFGLCCLCTKHRQIQFLFSFSQCDGRPQWTWTLSIAHRGTGIFLSAGWWHVFLNSLCVFVTSWRTAAVYHLTFTVCSLKLVFWPLLLWVVSRQSSFPWIPLHVFHSLTFLIFLSTYLASNLVCGCVRARFSTAIQMENKQTLQLRNAAVQTAL